MKKTESVKLLVDGGSATAGPPLGPALGPLGVNTGKVVEEINKKTASFNGMKVPVEVVVDTSTRSFEIKVGTPPTSALLLKELGVERGAKDKTPVGDMSIEQVIKVVNMKRDAMLANSLKAAVTETIGVCQSLGITVEGKTPREMIAEIKAGKHDSRIKE
ncbi:MAG: 50S ribosomal protein L11 [Candidatus Altiarchaeota archaeon]|nr:50S ribosomal protein L11 [Candidatus Altiarchaeota archaeon]